LGGSFARTYAGTGSVENSTGMIFDA